MENDATVSFFFPVLACFGDTIFDTLEIVPISTQTIVRFSAATVVNVLKRHRKLSNTVQFARIIWHLKMFIYLEVFQHFVQSLLLTS